MTGTEKPETEKARASRLILLGRRPHPRNTDRAVETLLRRIRADIRANVRYTRRDVRVAINHRTIVPGDRCELVTSSPQWPAAAVTTTAGKLESQSARPDTLCETTANALAVGVSTGITGRPSKRRNTFVFNASMYTDHNRRLNLISNEPKHHTCS